MTNNRVPPKLVAAPSRQVGIFPCARCDFHWTNSWVCEPCQGAGFHVDRTPKKHVTVHRLPQLQVLNEDRRRDAA